MNKPPSRLGIVDADPILVWLKDIDILTDNTRPSHISGTDVANLLDNFKKKGVGTKIIATAQNPQWLAPALINEFDHIFFVASPTAALRLRYYDATCRLQMGSQQQNWNRNVLRDAVFDGCDFDTIDFFENLIAFYHHPTLQRFLARYRQQNPRAFIK
jgi:hypothetical protein